MRRYVLVTLVAVMLLSLAAFGARTSSAQAGRTITISKAGGGRAGPMSGVAAQSMERGTLPADPEALARLKAEAARDAGLASGAETANPAPAAVTPLPTLLLGKDGLEDPNGTPSDSTGAIGTTRYIETVNRKAGLYGRGFALFASATLNTWYGQLDIANSFDPQVIWDPTTARFYYAGDTIYSSSDHRLSFGYSKSDTPADFTSASWCQYQVSYGSNFPDYPKLGDSTHFIIIGVNTFSGSTSGFVGADIVAISKPPAGTTCQDASTFKSGIVQDTMVGTARHFTPVPANSIDANSTGYVLARPASLPATSIGLFKVTRDPTTGNPVFSAGASVAVPSYTVPANAPQSGATQLLDTLDARMTQAVAAFDPLRGKFAIWTQHTIHGGAGAAVRWYEISPATRALLQPAGLVSHNSLSVFNGAISPDRVVNGSTSAYGQNMILNFNTSSPTTFPSLYMVGKRRNDTTSGFKLLKASPGPQIEFSCQSSGSVCRWGDYAAATPDPLAATTGAAGIVWSTSMWNKDGRLNPGGVNWQTYNWRARP